MSLLLQIPQNRSHHTCGKLLAFFIKHVIFTFTVCFCEKTSGRESSSEGSEAMLRPNRMTAIFFSCEIALQEVLSMQSVQQLQRLKKVQEVCNLLKFFN